MSDSNRAQGLINALISALWREQEIELRAALQVEATAGASIACRRRRQVPATRRNAREFVASLGIRRRLSAFASR